MSNSTNDILAPGYTVAKSADWACISCGAFEGGFCKMFNQPVEATFTCDEWVKTWSRRLIG